MSMLFKILSLEMIISNRDISMGSMKWTKEIDLEVMQINSIEDQKHS